MHIPSLNTNPSTITPSWIDPSPRHLCQSGLSPSHSKIIKKIATLTQKPGFGRPLARNQASWCDSYCWAPWSIGWCRWSSATRYLAMPRSSISPLVFSTESNFLLEIPHKETSVFQLLASMFQLFARSFLVGYCISYVILGYFGHSSFQL